MGHERRLQSVKECSATCAPPPQSKFYVVGKRILCSCQVFRHCLQQHRCPLALRTRYTEPPKPVALPLLEPCFSVQEGTCSLAAVLQGRCNQPSCTGTDNARRTIHPQIVMDCMDEYPRYGSHTIDPASFDAKKGTHLSSSAAAPWMLLLHAIATDATFSKRLGYGEISVSPSCNSAPSKVRAGALTVRC